MFGDYMSSDKRPWFKWYPKEFLADEKVQSLSPLAELIYRRALDLMWQANACRLLGDCLRLANALSRGISSEDFKKAWDEIQTPGFELLKKDKDERFLYSKRLREQMQEIENKREKKVTAGRLGGQASAKAKVKQVLEMRSSKKAAN